MIITAQIVMLIILSPKKCELCKKSKTPKLHIYLGIFPISKRLGCDIKLLGSTINHLVNIGHGKFLLRQQCLFGRKIPKKFKHPHLI